MKRTIPMLIAGVVGFILIFSSFVPAITSLKETTESYFLVIAAFGAILGAASLLHMHGMKVFKKRPGWGYSIITIVGFFATMAVGLFKVGVPGQYGAGAILRGAGDAIGEVTLTDESATNDENETIVVRKLTLKLYKLPADSTQPLFIDDQKIGDVPIDEHGRATAALTVKYPPHVDLPATQADGAALADRIRTPLIEGALAKGGLSTDAAPFVASLAIPPLFIAPDKERVPFTKLPVKVGDSLTGVLESYSWITGLYLTEGTPYWFSYEYILKPLQATMFALLAFYVASAAFRAFRARNMESTVLLLTAFIILLGRTAAGAFLTQSLPETGFWSFFRIVNLTGWIMDVFNTAGNRAILIGVALGIASTSLKILLGIDRSYLGQDKG